MPRIVVITSPRCGAEGVSTEVTTTGGSGPSRRLPPARSGGRSAQPTASGPGSTGRLTLTLVLPEAREVAAPARRHLPARSAESGEDGVSRADVEAGRLLERQMRDHAIVDDGGIAPVTGTQAPPRKVDLQAHGPGQFAIAVGQ
jgi:hypothetical protein